MRKTVSCQGARRIQRKYNPGRPERGDEETQLLGVAEKARTLFKVSLSGPGQTPAGEHMDVTFQRMRSYTSV